MRYKLILAIMLSVTLPVNAQYLSIGLRAGLGVYSMEDLESFQEFRRKESGLPLQTTESYPITPNFRFEIANNVTGLINKYGLFYTFNSTGARSTISDYSGRLDLDAVIIGNQAGITIDHVLKKRTLLEHGIYAEAAYLWTRLKTTDYLHLIFPEEYEEAESYRFKSNGISSEFGLFLQYNLGNLRARMNLGYQFGLSGKLYLLNDKRYWLVLNNKSLKPKWDGIRLGLQLDFMFNGSLILQ
ncbi:MAG: hypothetical protein IQL11_05655 [Bacteroidales bacterium]|nr:hypothetical protein [Bacteroidales bacterium]